MFTKQLVLREIDSCILSTKSSRKKTVGLPKLKSDIVKLTDLKKIKDVLVEAINEEAPTDLKPADNACKYWVNRHSSYTFRVFDKDTNTKKALQSLVDEYGVYFNSDLGNSKVYEKALPPTKPLMLGKTTAISKTTVTNMKQASRRGDKQIVFLGHGETTLNTHIQIPQGTSVHFYTYDQAFLRDVDVRAIACPEVWGRHKVPTVREVAGPGATIKEHYIGELDHQGLGGHIDNPAFLGGVMFNSIRTLSSLLVPNMGVVHFAACRAHPTDDMIAFNKGGGVNADSIEPQQRRDSVIENLMKVGGLPNH
ncbi:putative adhesin [Vibrio pectenicida]|uniref:putative adhesin n=1 Tax=Vibrio pectenicida TaxID=62763 RepID=UPI003081605E